MEAPRIRNFNQFRLRNAYHLERLGLKGLVNSRTDVFIDSRNASQTKQFQPWKYIEYPVEVQRGARSRHKRNSSPQSRAFPKSPCGQVRLMRRPGGKSPGRALHQGLAQPDGGPVSTP